MMIRHSFVVLCLFSYFSTCCGILMHGTSNSSHANGITSHESSTDYSSTQQKFEQEVTELQNIVAKLSGKFSALEKNHTELEKENLELKTLVNHLNRSFMLQQYESRMLAIQLASMESDLRTLNNASNKTNNDVSNLSNITLDIRHTLGENNEQDQNSTERLIEIERIMNKTNNDVSNLFHITLDIRQSMEKNNEQDQNSTGRLNEIERVINETNKHVSNLSNITLDIKQTLGKNNEHDKNSTRRLNEIDRVMNYLKAQLRSSAVSFIDMERRADEMNSSMSLLNTTLLNLQRDVLKKVAFTASVSSSSSSWNSGTLVFPVVITNVGNGYNPNNGIFTAPTNGNYVFFVNVQSYSSQTIYVDIVLNGSTKVRTMAYGGSNDYFHAGPNLVVLTLQKGDTVWVKHHSGQGYWADGSLTTFSGFLI